MTLIQWLAILSASGFLVFVGIGFYMYRKNKVLNKGNPLDFGRTAGGWDAQRNIFAQKSYAKLSKIPLLSGLIQRVRKRLETLSIYDEYKLRREVMKIVHSIIALLAFIVILLLIVRPSFQVIFWIALGLVIISSIVIDVFVHRVEVRLLKQLKDYNNRVRNHYNQTKMVDESVYEAIQYAGPEMKIQAEKIYHILTSVDSEKELEKYEEIAPSRFLKVIAGLALYVKDYGDVKKENNSSSFLHGLTKINQEINLEILFRSALAYSLKGLSIVALIPVFFAKPFQEWASTSFPIMESFYESRIGFLFEVLVYGVSLGVYFIIRKMAEVDESRYKASIKRTKWEEWALKKIPGLRFVVTHSSPKPYSKQHFKLKKLIKDANSPLKLEWLTLRRLLLMVFTVILIVSGLIYAHEREKNSALYSIGTKSIMVGNLSVDEYEELKELNEFDRQVIAEIENIEKPTPEKVQAYLSEQFGLDEFNSPEANRSYNRILEKWQVVNNAYLKWYEVILALAIGIFVWYIPIFFLQLQKYLRYKDMENEVHQFLILISILREFDRMSVYTILSWLERIGVVFKEPIQKTLQIYDSGPEESLQKLREEVNFEAFNQLVERLELSISRISIKEAFEDIDMELEFYLDQREELNKRTIESKSEWGKMICWIPILTVTIFYLVGPLIYLSVVESNNLISHLSNF